MSSFKILFICGCFESGKDGIGDYTRKLALECLNHHVQVAVLAMYDGYVKHLKSVDIPFPVLRIEKGASGKDRLEQSLQFKNQIGPDCISIQFMPYALNDRGIVFSQIKLYKNLVQDTKVHIMFHELWIGQERGAGLKNSMLGYLQRLSITRLIKNIEPSIIHASLPINIAILNNYHFTALHLPLFGNIAITHKLDFDWLYFAIQKSNPGFTNDSKSDYILFGLFGTLYNNWDLNSLMDKIKSDPSIADEKKIILSIGEIGKGISRWNRLKGMHGEIEFILLGRRTEEEISQFLQFVDFGIATTPQLLLGKSGSYVAMKEHGLPILCDNNHFRFNFDLTSEIYETGCIIVDHTSINFSQLKTKKMHESNLKIIAHQFLQDLKVDVQ